MGKNSIVQITPKNKQDLEELQMIKAARMDIRAFGDLYELYVEQVFRYLYSRIGDLHDAEDVTAQTFLAAFESFDGFRQNDHFASWLFTIARNKAIDYFRQRNRYSSIGDASEIATESDPLSGVIRSEQSLVLARLIRVLPEEERELLRLRFLAEMSYPEIAHLLHRNEDAIKKSTYRLLARLHSQMEDSNE